MLSGGSLQVGHLARVGRVPLHTLGKNPKSVIDRIVASRTYLYLGGVKMAAGAAFSKVGGIWRDIFFKYSRAPPLLYW